ncbi:hypothetical protein SESBI_40605 [Sesbania bispinosa]|nr:hypothetical protein SESBI_40605 [Sesbania bispinosa]
MKPLCLQHRMFHVPPKATILPTLNAMRTPKKDMEFIFHLRLPERTGCWTADTLPLEIRPNRKATPHHPPQQELDSVRDTHPP